MLALAGRLYPLDPVMRGSALVYYKVMEQARSEAEHSKQGN